MSDFIMRLQEEKNELSGRVHKLGKFIESDKFLEVSYFQRCKLREQHEIMKRYYGCLNVRLLDLEMQQQSQPKS